MSKERRIAARKEVDYIQVNDLTSVADYAVIARTGKITNASTTGFLLEINRSDLVPEDLRNNLSLESTLGKQVVLYLPQMNLDLDGTISRASHKGKGTYVVAIEFSPDVPEYWRACLIDLLPQPGEIEFELEE
jgi:hypothetical protein